MKYILLIVFLAVAVYIYLDSKVAVSVVVSNYPDLLSKVEAQSVTLEEVKIGANSLVLTFCNDSGFQQSGGSTTESCMKKYKGYRNMCENRIFASGPIEYSSKEDVIKVAKRFSACVGIE